MLLIKLFVEKDNVGKAINALTEGGITGFFLHECKGVSPKKFKVILEDLDEVVEAIRELSDAVIIKTVVDEKKIKTLEDVIGEKLSNEKYTVIKIPIRKIKINTCKKR
ncbi:MJ1244 family protein [Methanotorris formicicus]|uniref:Nitrogen regulatory protein P-II n=1 Tax=Methanotorris formicicus Mc-S-70 TaxID=647171 RepID=H1KXH8_9EURY|nr:Protein of unknown function, nitrogen regulatory protein PII-related [Methanotorris formicicus Mc-S-70]